MQKWEYKIMPGSDHEGLTGDMNKLGAEGWAFVAQLPSTDAEAGLFLLLFKRPMD
jgi:hypothetical protein